MTVTLQNTAQSLLRCDTYQHSETAMTYRALSSGRRVHRAAEDAAGLAVAKRWMHRCVVKRRRNEMSMMASQ